MKTKNLYARRIERLARLRGFRLVRSRDGSYGLVDPESNAWVACDWDNHRGYGLSLDQVEGSLGQS